MTSPIHFDFDEDAPGGAPNAGSGFARRSVAAIVLTLGLALTGWPADCAAKNTVDWGVDADPDLAEAMEAIEGGDFERAIPHLRTAERAYPGNADIHNLLGLCYRQVGELDNAMRHYRKALEIEPGHLGAHEYLGELYLMRDELNKAEEHLEIIKSSLSCLLGCEEYRDLERVIEQYRDNRGE